MERCSGITRRLQGFARPSEERLVPVDLEDLKRLPRKNPDLQVSLLTGQTCIQKGVEAMELGTVDFLEKPADIEMLSGKIREAQAKKMSLVENRLAEKINSILRKRGW